MITTDRFGREGTGQEGQEEDELDDVGSVLVVVKGEVEADPLKGLEGERQKVVIMIVC